MTRHWSRSRLAQRMILAMGAAAIGGLSATLCPAADKPKPPAVAPADAEKKPKPKPATAPPAAPVPSGPVTPEQVKAAIEKAQNWLLKHQNKEGNWEEVQKPEKSDESINLKGRQWGGLTSIATYALLASGKDPRSTPELQRAVNFLLHANITSTYALGLSSQIVLFINEKDPARADLIKRNVVLLEQGMHQPAQSAINQPAGWPASTGFYTYGIGAPNQPNTPEFGKTQLANLKIAPLPNNKDAYDRSNSQYGVLGMWALAEAGGEVSTLYWQIEDAAWKHAQHNDGGWDYKTGGDENKGPTPSMTAAGIATLYITQDYTLVQDWQNCKGGVKNVKIESALHWMDQHITQALAGEPYTLYGIERIGTASGRKYFEKVDWYKVGAEFLVKHQAADGSWSGSRGAIPDTSFGLLFLSRGRAPVMMNKLQYGPTAQFGKDNSAVTDPWDERPRDVANLARWVGHGIESYLNWQVVNLKVGPEDLHDAPILYLSGSVPMDFSKEEIDKLRTYVEQGGMILGNADCVKEAFSKSFKDLGKKLFPKYEFQLCPPNDFVYNEQFKAFRNKPKVMELTNNVRKLMVLIPESDPSRAWQTRSSGTKEEGFGLGANIYLYSTDQTPTPKDETYMVRANPAIQTGGKSMRVARLDVGDNADPEPGAWPRMAAVMHNTQKIDLQVSTVKPEALAGFKVASLTGTGKLSLSGESRAALKKFVEDGGTLVVDAAGGDAAFADTAEDELKSIWPNAKIELLPNTSEVYSYPTAKIDRVGWRRFALDKVADKRNPKLRGITFGKRVGVFFSREDITAGLVGEPVDGIYGYDPKTATDIMSGILLYAHTGGALPNGAPVAAKPEAPQANTK